MVMKRFFQYAACVKKKKMAALWDNSATHIESNHAAEASFHNSHWIINCGKLFQMAFLRSSDAPLEAC